MAPTTLYIRGTDDHSWPSYDWSTDYRQSQSHYSGYLTWDGSFSSISVSETATVRRTHRSDEYLREEPAHRSQTVSLDYGGANQNGAATSTSYVVCD